MTNSEFLEQATNIGRSQMPAPVKETKLLELIHKLRKQVSETLEVWFFDFCEEIKQKDVATYYKIKWHVQ